MMKLLKSPVKKINAFLYKSRENAKVKYRDMKVKCRNLERRHEYASNKIKHFKEQIAE